MHCVQLARCCAPHLLHAPLLYYRYSVYSACLTVHTTVYCVEGIIRRATEQPVHYDGQVPQKRAPSLIVLLLQVNVPAQSETSAI